LLTRHGHAAAECCFAVFATGRAVPTLRVSNMIANRIVLVSALFLSSAYSIAGERLYGKYETITESECNFTLILNAKGHGSFTKSCRLEDGSHQDVFETRNETKK
jgi:hypothetical protein